MSVRNVLITGSSRGIGLEFVRQLVAQSSPPKNVFAACRDPDNAKNLLEIKNSTTKTAVHLVKLDVTCKTSITAASEYVQSIVGDEGLNVLINNAGIFLNTPHVLDVTEEEMLSQFRINTVGPLLCTQAFLGLLRTASAKHAGEKMSFARAAIVNISSLLGSVTKVPDFGSRATAYGVSKAGENMVTRKTAAEVKEDGILVVSFHPGYVATDMNSYKGVVKASDSVLGMLQVLQNLDDDTGSFFDYLGNRLPW